MDAWPLFGLRVRTPHLELRYPDDDLVAALAALATQGIHDPGWMPFGQPWTDAPRAELARNTCQYVWRQRAELSTESWHLPLAVVAAGEVVGVQEIFAAGFAVRRGFETGSWLGQAYQGKGIGKEMRAAVLHLGFAGLGALEAHTGAWHDNAASLSVTRALGYAPNGERRDARRGAGDRMLLFRLTRDAWERQRRDDIAFDGLDACLPLLGL